MILQNPLSCQLLCYGQEFFPALVADIASAKDEIRLETYIFRFDSAGEPIANALLNAAMRGVNVYLLIDGAGTPHIPSSWMQKFQAAHIHYMYYVPLGWSWPFLPKKWRRLHRKLCVIDQRVAYCGGINIIDDMIDPYRGPLESPRLDFTVRFQGELAVEVAQVMRTLWSRYTLYHQWSNQTVLKWISPFQEKIQAVQKTKYIPKFKNFLKINFKQEHLFLVLRDNINNHASIEMAYLSAITQARYNILIANAYFLPGKRFRNALLDARKRGVRVRLMLQGRCDNFLEFHAVRPLLVTLMHAGIEIFECTRGFLHAKVAVIDGVWSTVGSSNLDPLSLLMAREANIIIEGGDFAHRLQSELEAMMKSHFEQLIPTGLLKRSWLVRTFDRLLWVLARALVRFFDQRY